MLRQLKGRSFSPPRRQEPVTELKTAPKPKLATEPDPTRQPEPPARVVRRTRKWYDASERPSISDMQF
jgi:hypothetical protein